MEIRIIKEPMTKDEIDQRVKEGKFFHREAAMGRWYKLSFEEQMGNIGLGDSRWEGRRMEIARARELFCSAALGETEYHTTLHDLDNYFLQFAFAARRNLS